MKFKEGDFVKYNAPTGSIGRIESLNNYGGYYVRWTYGRNVAGEEIKSSLSSYKDHELIEITQELYEKVRDGEAFKGDRQFENQAPKLSIEAKLTKATEALKNAEKYLTSCGYDKAEKGDPDRQMLEDFRKTLAEIGELK